MIRSTMSAFGVIALCFAIMQIPSSKAPIASVSAHSEPAAVLPVPDSDELWHAISALEGRVARLEARPECPCPIERPKAQPVSKATVTKAPYKARWVNHDGLSFRDHGIIVHGLSPSLSDEEMASQRDAYHDQYGGGHSHVGSPVVSSCPGGVCPVNTVNVSRTASSPSGYTGVTVQRSVSSCPGGVCPASRTTTAQRSGGLFGFGLLGRRR
jgi:hypothetical protein